MADQEESVFVKVDIQQTVVWETTIEMPRSKWEKLKQMPREERNAPFGILNGILDEPTGAMPYLVDAKLVTEEGEDIEPLDEL